MLMENKTWQLCDFYQAGQMVIASAVVLKCKRNLDRLAARKGYIGRKT